MELILLIAVVILWRRHNRLKRLVEPPKPEPEKPERSVDGDMAGLAFVAAAVIITVGAMLLG